MRCDQFEDRLNDVLDRRDDPRRDAPLIAHAAGCRHCRNLAAAYEVLTDGAANLRDAADPSPVEWSRKRRPEWVAVVAPLLATAAAALFMLYQTATIDESPTVQTPASAVAPMAAVVTLPTPAPQPVADEIVEPEPPIVVNLARTTGRAYVGLIHGTARGLDDALALAVDLPPAQQLLQPVLFPEDGLLRRTKDRLVPAAGETIDVLRQVFQSQDSQQL